MLLLSLSKIINHYLTQKKEEEIVQGHLVVIVIEEDEDHAQETDIVDGLDPGVGLVNAANRDKNPEKGKGLV